MAVKNKSFCEEMKEKTKQVHDKSDKLINLKLLVALTDCTLYGEVLYQFYRVFETLENALERSRDHPMVAPLVLRKLYRTEAFEKDLQFYLGEKWKNSTPTIYGSTIKYCDQINFICENDPKLLIAYAHSMYLAVLAGGQILRKIIKKTLGLDDEGLSIFDFTDCDRMDLRNQFTHNINNLELTETDKSQIIAEKIKVFQLNNAIANHIQPSIMSYKRITLFLISVLICILCFFYSMCLFL